MKILISSSILKKAVSFVSRAIRNNPIVPVLENIHFDLQDSKLTLKGSDLQTTLLASVQVDSTDSGKFLLPADKLIKFLSALPEQPITLLVDSEKFSTTLKWDSGKTKLSGDNAMDFPKMPEKKGQEFTLSLENDDLHRFMDGLGGTVYATSTDDLRPAMTGVYMHKRNEMLTFAATNGNILVEYPITGFDGEDIPKSIIPGNFVKSVLKAYQENEGSATLTLTPTNIEVAIGQFTLISRLIDERFPDYVNAIPTQNPLRLEVDKGKLTSALKLMLITASSTKIISFKVDNNNLRFSSADYDFSHESEEQISVTYADEPIEIGFNGDRLLTILSHLNGETVAFAMSAPNRAAILTGDDESITTLLMPEPIRQFA
ncbi:DNA polymerase III subunit beta [Spirosoma daeguense]